uniref:Uncharacterized protein n=1 Tax=Macrostomum lignano TaxID=282301 RepID=A0A1I8HH22_9PLAT
MMKLARRTIEPTETCRLRAPTVRRGLADRNEKIFFVVGCRPGGPGSSRQAASHLHWSRFYQHRGKSRCCVFVRGHHGQAEDVVLFVRTVAADPQSSHVLRPGQAGLGEVIRLAASVAGLAYRCAAAAVAEVAAADALWLRAIGCLRG